MKILFITPITFDSCSFYRSGGIASDLRERLGIDIDVLSWDKERFHWQILLKYNLIMMQRPYTDTALSMGQYAKDLGIPLWVDYDDLLLNVPATNKAQEGMIKSREIIENITRTADVITVSTPALKSEIEKYNDNIHIIPNAFNDYIFKRRKVTEKRNEVVAWRGSETHFADILQYQDQLVKSIEKHPRWIYSFMGFNPSVQGKDKQFVLLNQLFKNVLYVAAQDPILYFKNIVTIAPSVFHVPLVDNVFNRCKSNIALIEAAYSGSLCIAPDWEEWRMPGALLYSDGRSYLTHMENAIAGNINVKRNSDMVWEYITDNLMLSKINLMRAELVKSLLR